MLKVNAKPFVDVMYRLGNIRQELLSRVNAGDTRNLCRSGPGADPWRVASMLAELDALGLPTSAVSARRLRDLTERPEVGIAEVLTAISELAGRMDDELSSTYFFSLSPSESALVDPASFLFGDVVAAQFPTVMSEVLDGSKCLGLGLPTASAFHYIRCLESGISAMSRCLSIADPIRGSDRSWTKLLGKIKVAIDAKWPVGPIRSGDAQFFEEALAMLAAIQNPYRNATMHLDQRYEAREAQHIQAMVEGFMRKLASRMDEDGRPLA